MEHAGRGQVRDFEHRLADDRRLFGEEIGDLAAHHPAHDLVNRGGVDAVGRDVLAVAHDRDGVAEGEDLVEAVRDEDDRASLVAKASSDSEEAVDLDPAECCGRLVHDEHPGVERDRFGNLDDLLVGDRQSLGPAVGVDAHAQSSEETLDLGAHGRAVDPSESANRLPTHENVFGDRQVGEECGLLVNYRDPGGLGFGGRLKGDRLALEEEFSCVALVQASDDLDKCGLPGAIFANERVDRV